MSIVYNLIALLVLGVLVGLAVRRPNQEDQS